MLHCDSYLSGSGILDRREQWSAPTSASQSKVNACAKQTRSIAVALLAGIFSLWLSLTIPGVIGLNGINRGFLSSLSLRILIASDLALMACIIGFPLFAPWLVAFVPAYLFIPRNCILWKWWLCTVAGALIGIVALWADALVCSFLTPGPSFSLNVPLLMSASMPAAVLGGAICFTASVEWDLRK
jgi:hypothetical protein